MEKQTGYYVTMMRGARVAWLLGPFRSHDAALAMVDAARGKACEIDARSHWDAFGTSSITPECGLMPERNGVLNRFFPEAEGLAQ